MPVYFVKTAALIATPNDTNDGRDAFGFALTAATFTNATKTLSQTGAFTSYTFTAGDQIYISGGTGVTAGLYEIASKTSNDAIVLVADIGGTNPTDVTSSNGPWATIQKGLDTAIAGDTVRICADGTHAPTLELDIDTNSGTVDDVIVHTGATARGVVDGTRPTIQPGVDDRAILFGAVSHIRLQHLDVDAQNTGLVGIHAQLANHIRFLRVNVHDSQGAGFDVDADKTFQLVGCEAANNSTIGFSVRGHTILLGCSSHGNGTIGINVTGIRDVTLSHCLVYGNGDDGIQFASGTFMTLNVLNCTIDKNGGHGVDMLNSATSSQFCLFNSIISNHSGVGKYGVNRNGSEQWGMAGNNLYYNNTAHVDSSGGVSETDFDSIEDQDPDYTSTTLGSEDYALQSTSPAIDAGYPGAF